MSLPGRRSLLSAHVARALSTGVTLIAVVFGSAWRILAMLGRGLRWGTRPDRGLPEGGRRWVTHARESVRYLLWFTDEFPRLDGTVRKPGESPGPWDEARRRLRRSRLAMVSWTLLAIYLTVGVAAQAGWIAAEHKATDKAAVFVPPGWFDGPWFLGTDNIGHSVGAMALHGTATALWVGLVSAVIACFLGTVFGALAGYFGRWVDGTIVWLYTTLESIPEMLLVLSFAFVFKVNQGWKQAYDESFLATSWGISAGLFTIVLAIGLTFWTGVCRQVRGEFIRQRERDYVTAARALGVPTGRIMFRHIYPNAFHLVLISFSLLFMGAIKYEVVLTFLGVGVEPGESSWGVMINQAKLELLREPMVWWQLTTATLALFGLVLAVNLFTDALRDALDPRLRT